MTQCVKNVIQFFATDHWLSAFTGYQVDARVSTHAVCACAPPRTMFETANTSKQISLDTRLSSEGLRPRSAMPSKCGNTVFRSTIIDSAMGLSLCGFCGNTNLNCIRVRFELSCQGAEVFEYRKWLECHVVLSLKILLNPPGKHLRRD